MRKKTKADPVTTALEAATKSGRYMVAVWHIEAGDIKMHRTTHAFPTPNFEACINMLDIDLKKEATG